MALEDEVWGLHYKTGATPDTASRKWPNTAAPFRIIYAGKAVRGALVFADGTLSEM